MVLTTATPRTSRSCGQQPNRPAPHTAKPWAHGSPAYRPLPPDPRARDRRSGPTVDPAERIARDVHNERSVSATPWAAPHPGRARPPSSAPVPNIGKGKVKVCVTNPGGDGVYRPAPGAEVWISTDRVFLVHSKNHEHACDRPIADGTHT